uniref:G2/mitotic-specific cyclin-B3 n=1 Tax=Panagrolaimus sp. ES5 TaxID=591445 RepID=A0AC34GZE5_9BILA
MLLRNRNLPSQNEVKGEKRQNKGAAGDAEPKAKRVALTDISNTFSNVLLDSSKKPPIDQKPRVLTVKKAVDPCPEFDFDKECGKDTVQVTDYANDIFQYYSHRQSLFQIGDYMKNQRYISGDMRAILVNWLVNVQEQFELNHETLYLAVKIVDIYLTRTKSDVRRADLQLLGGTAIFLASKFDERVAPMIDDILYMCEDNYTADQIIKMELLLFKTVGFDLGIPISYRFLRRFSRVVKLEMHTLTLARYILETSLMFYQFVGIKDDLMAAASLLLALRMKKLDDWSAKLVKYTGYTLQEVEPLMKSLNHMIIKRRADYERLDVIFNKYSHEIFFEVAKIPSLQDDHVLSDPIGPPENLSFH